ncbi:MAG: DUF2628 domain-containing protein [Bauldia litoralis]|uniref:DUF2628 domain-containing protein n=1 Tax=Bauldia litoralis TaxID=665467 RepID=UPI003296FBCB
MALYTIHAPVMADGEPADPVDLVAIKDGFCWPALFIPLIWTIYRRLWLVVLLLVVGLIVLALLAPLGGLAVGGAFLLGRLYFALEANGPRRWTLESRGYRLVGVAEGRSVEEAERRFFAAWSPADMDDRAAPAEPEPPAPPPPATPLLPWKRPLGDSQVVGLFPTPGLSR